MKESRRNQVSRSVRQIDVHLERFFFLKMGKAFEVKRSNVIHHMKQRKREEEGKRFSAWEASSLLRLLRRFAR